MRLLCVEGTDKPRCSRAKQKKEKIICFHCVQTVDIIVDCRPCHTNVLILRCMRVSTFYITRTHTNKVQSNLLVVPFQNETNNYYFGCVQHIFGPTVCAHYSRPRCPVRIGTWTKFVWVKINFSTFFKKNFLFVLFWLRK